MEANFKVANGRLTFKVSGEKAKDVWAQIAQIEELFCAETKCGLCGCAEFRYGHRVAMKGTKPCHYYELVCRKCGAQFSFGQRQDTGELFPKRRHHDTRQPLPNGGWRKWEDRSVDPDEGEYEQQSPQAAPASAPQGQRPPAQPRPAPTPQQPPKAGTAQSKGDLKYAPDDAPWPTERW